jgi:hypothetical protein
VDADNPGYKQVSSYTDANVAIQLHAKAYLLFLQLKAAILAPLYQVNHQCGVCQNNISRLMIISG